ncbi:hypothetical protein LTR17_009641 [Elasticomyces elasticus]|nr:hypothetical protein LTR17_009641 [Elasticomyces elasticus]
MVATSSRPQAHMQEQPQQPFRFLDLPRELRDEIYKFCVVDGRHRLLPEPEVTTINRPIPGDAIGSYENREQYHWFWPIDTVGLHYCSSQRPAILSISRQIRSEVLQIFYSEHRFCFSGCRLADALDWLIVVMVSPSAVYLWCIAVPTATCD